jgi:iron complex outermembrane receptor protein
MFPPRITGCLLVSSGVVFFAGPAGAADTYDVAAADIETVTVRQWVEDQLAVPETVETLGRDRLGSPLWDDMSALAIISPNTQVQQSTVESRIVLRGMTAISTGIQDPVWYFVNGVALPFGASNSPHAFDAESIEIAKGPQGVLFGRNTEAGAVIVRTRDPSATPEASLSVAPRFLDGPDGWASGVETSGRLSGALTDRLSGSVAVRYQTTDGVYRNLYDGRDDGGSVDRYTVSSGLRYAIDEDTEMMLKSVVEENDRGKARMRYLTGTYATAPHTTNYNVDARDDYFFAVQSFEIDRHFAGANLTAITGWTHFDRNFRMDFDLSPVAAPASELKHRDDALSQEIRLASGTEGALRWLTGVYFSRQWSDLDYATQSPRIWRKTSINQTNFAAFGQIEYEMLQGLRVSLGSRVEWISEDGDQNLIQTRGTSSYGKKMETTTFLPRVTVSYDVSDHFVVFGSYARGYMPGGYNYNLATSVDTLTYDPEYSWTGEIGVKTRLLASRLHLGVSAFHTATRDRQILDLVVGGTQKISNASRAETYGAEVSSRFLLTPAFSVFATGGLMHAEATSYKLNKNVNGILTEEDLSGNRLPMAADYTYSLGARYDAGSDGPFGEVSLNGSGPYYFDSDNALRQKAFALVDASLGYRFDRYEISVWTTNLFDKHIYTRMTTAKLGMVVEDGNPREVGVRLAARW